MNLKNHFHVTYYASETIQVMCMLLFLRPPSSSILGCCHIRLLIIANQRFDECSCLIARYTADEEEKKKKRQQTPKLLRGKSAGLGYGCKGLAVGGVTVLV